MHAGVPDTLVSAVIVESGVIPERAFRDAEVEELGLPLGEQDVGRFQIAMNDALAVCGFQGSYNLQGDCSASAGSIGPARERRR